MVRQMGAASLLVLAAGCASENAGTLKNVRSELLGRVTLSQAEIEAQKAAANAAVVADPDSLRNFPSPILLVAVPRSNTLGVIGPMTDDGTESVWFSADGTSFTFRAGQVVATRGLTRDLQSAEVPDVRRQRGDTVRDLYFRDGDERIRRERFYCTITDTGPAEAEVLGRIYPARRVTEECASDHNTFTNAYWIEDNGDFRLSRQWISPEIGYVAVQKVQD